jgi:hypothetical protein
VANTSRSQGGGDIIENPEVKVKSKCNLLNSNVSRFNKVIFSAQVRDDNDGLFCEHSQLNRSVIWRKDSI